jgi:Holliday junction resolvase-like predicted endonuclease
MFDSTEEEFTARTVQEGFKLAERNKLQKLVKTAEFWQGYKVNLTKLSVDFKAEFMKQNPKATKEENFKEFFQRLEKFSTK